MTDAIEVTPILHVRRLHIVRTAKKPHFFPIVTFGKGKALMLMEVYGNDCRIINPADSLFGCECSYEENTATQYRSCRVQTFDNPNLDITSWTKWMDETKDIENEMRTMYAALTSQTCNRHLTPSKTKSDCALLSYRFLYETDKRTGKANYDGRHLLALWTFESNGFLGKFKYEEDFLNPDEPKVKVKEIAIYKVCSDCKSIQFAKHYLFQEIACELVCSRELEIKNHGASEDSKKDKIAAEIKRAMSDPNNYETMTCTDAFQPEFQVGLAYPTLPMKSPITPLQNSAIEMVAFDDQNKAHEVMRDFFSRD